MANFVQFTNILAGTFVSKSSRYIDSQVLYYSENKLLTFNTYKKHTIILSNSDKFTSITKGIEYRPDLLSFDFYGSPDFWWKIMEVNDMKDIMEFKAGRTIRLPSNILT